MNMNIQNNIIKNINTVTINIHITFLYDEFIIGDLHFGKFLQ